MIHDNTEIECDIPAGYRIKRIGTPKKGELYLEQSKDAEVLVAQRDSQISGRIILEKIEYQFAFPDWVPRGVWYVMHQNGKESLHESEPILKGNLWRSDGLWTFIKRELMSFPDRSTFPRDEWRNSKTQNL